MADVIVIAIILGIVGAAAAYIRKEKKRGSVCIGCPHAGSCSQNCNKSHDHPLSGWHALPL